MINPFEDPERIKMMRETNERIKIIKRNREFRESLGPDDIDLDATKEQRERDQSRHRWGRCDARPRRDDSKGRIRKNKGGNP